jgi:translation initiation factor IF-2
VLDKYCAECRQKAECNVALNKQVAGRDYALDVYRRYRTCIEEFVQSVKDVLEWILEPVKNREVNEVMLRADALGILEALLADLEKEVSLHQVQRE